MATFILNPSGLQRGLSKLLGRLIYSLNLYINSQPPTMACLYPPRRVTYFIYIDNLLGNLGHVAAPLSVVREGLAALAILCPNMEN